MAEPYTPTKYEVLEAWVAHTSHDQPTAYDLVEAGESFNRWLAQHEAAIRRDQIEKDAQIAESLDFGPDGPPLHQASRHRWGAKKAAERIRARLNEVQQKWSDA